MWHLPRLGIKPLCPVLAGGVLSTGPAGESPFCVFKTSSSTCNKIAQNCTQAHIETHKSLYIILKIWIHPTDYTHVHTPVLILYYSDARWHHGEKLDGCTENFHAFCNSLWFCNCCKIKSFFKKTTFSNNSLITGNQTNMTMKFFIEKLGRKGQTSCPPGSCYELNHAPPHPFIGWSLNPQLLSTWLMCK